MSATLKQRKCRERPLIGCAIYKTLRQNDIFKEMNIPKHLKGGKIREFMMEWINNECIKSKNIFVSNLIELHQEVNNYGKNNNENNNNNNNNNNRVTLIWDLCLFQLHGQI